MKAQLLAFLCLIVLLAGCVDTNDTTTTTTPTTTTTIIKLLNLPARSMLLPIEEVKETLGGEWILTTTGSGKESASMQYKRCYGSDPWTQETDPWIRYVCMNEYNIVYDIPHSIDISVYRFNSSEDALNYTKMFIGLKPEPPDVAYSNVSSRVVCNDVKKILIEKNNISETSYTIFAECNLECTNKNPDDWGRVLSLQEVFIISLKHNTVTLITYQAQIDCNLPHSTIMFTQYMQERSLVNNETIPKLTILADKQNQYIDKVWSDLHLIQ